VRLQLRDPIVRELYATRPEISLSTLVEADLRAELGMPPKTRAADSVVDIRIHPDVTRELLRQHPKAGTVKILRNSLLASLNRAASKESRRALFNVMTPEQVQTNEAYARGWADCEAGKKGQRPA